MPWHNEHFASKAAFAGFSSGSAGSGATVGPEEHAARHHATTHSIIKFFMTSFPSFVCHLRPK
jgi:hypothetical protein